MAKSYRTVWATLYCGLAAALGAVLFPAGLVSPAAGLALGLTIRWGARYWTALAVGHAVGLLAVDAIAGPPREWPATLALEILRSLALGTGAWLGNWLFRLKCPGLTWLRHPREVAWLTLSALLAATPAALAAWIATGIGFIRHPWPSFLSHAACTLAIPPVILLGDRVGALVPDKRRRETALTALAVLGIGTLFFSPISNEISRLHLESLLLLPLFWGSLRLTSFQSAALALLATIMVWCGTQAGYGVFFTPNDPIGANTALVFSSGLVAMVLLGTAMTRTRDQAIQDAREVEGRFRDLLEYVQMVAVILDFRGRVLFANQYLLRLTGWALDEVRGQDWFERFVPFAPQERETFVGALGAEASLPSRESEIQTRSGERLTIRWNSVVLRDAAGGVIGAANLGEDLSGRRAAEVQLRLQGAALAASANGMMISDAEGRIAWINRAFAQLCGYSEAELLGATPRLLQSGQHSREFYRDIWSAVLAGRIWKGEIINRHKSGRFYTVETTISPVADATGRITHFVAVQQDVTEKRELQQRVLQAQNMESVGRLAGGIAHAFNNLLQVILGSSEFLQQQLPAGERLRGEALEIDRAAKQAAGLTNQLLAFSRQQVMSPRPLQINQLLRHTESMLRRLVSENIAISYALEPALPQVHADAVQVEQLLLNLATHGVEAMPDGGHLWISTSAVALTADRLPPAVSVRPGPFVCLAIRDSGPGLDQQQRAHLLEPFYSPRAPGHLSGLGLAVVDGIVRQHAGFVDIESPPGQGTTFRIYLPAFVATEPPTAVSATGPGAAPPPAGRRKVLLVEDDDAVRRLALRVLMRAGYDVTEAASAADARAHFAQPGAPFDALFTDVVLTDGSGLDLVAEFSQQQPDLAVLVASGYTDDKARWSQIRRQGYRYLQKPYTAEQVRQELAEILAPPPGAAQAPVPPA